MQTVEHTRVSRDDVVEFPRRSSVSNAATTAQKRSLIHYHLAALNALRPRIPQHSSSALKPIRYQSLLARFHHAVLLFQAYLHLPATIFFDYNALYVLVQIAFYPDQGAGSSSAWWIASGIYGACFLIWLIVVVAIWEIVINYKRRWVNDQPFAMPIYCSSSAFTLTAVRSFSLYSLLYRTRLSANRKDFLIESCWFYSQNWPTVLTLLPRGIIIAVVLTLYNPTSATPRPTLGAGAGGSGGGQSNVSIRDSVYFDIQTGLLSAFSYITLLLYVAWIVWRLVLLSTSWIGLLALLGPRFTFKRERQSYEIEQGTEYDPESSYFTSRHGASSSAQPEPLDQTPPVGGANNDDTDRAGKRRSVRMSSVTIAESERDEVRAQAGYNSLPVHRRPASVDIPRRTQSLNRAGEVPRRTRSDAVKSSPRGADETSLLRSPLSVQRKHRLARQDAFVRQTHHSVPDAAAWAWRARAEERMRLFLSQCQDAVATEEGSFEWVEIPARHPEAGQSTLAHARTGTRSLDVYERHRRSLRDSDRGIAAFQLAEESMEHEQEENEIEEEESVDDRTEAPARLSSEVKAASQRSRRNSTSSELARQRDSHDSQREQRNSRRSGELTGTPALIARSGDEELIYRDRDDGNQDEGDEDGQSVSTEDSEERRIWSAFPEQSRRHPPGLIAVEMQHRQMEGRRRSNEEDRRERESSVASVSTSSASTASAAPVTVTSPGSPPAPSFDPSIAVAAIQGSNTSLQLPTSPSEGLLPIQEESWSSTSSVVDEEHQLTRSYLHSPAPT